MNVGDEPLHAPASPASVAAEAGSSRRGTVAAELRKLLGWIELAGKVTLVAALLGELTVVVTDVSIRFLFTKSLLWAEEMSKICLTTLAFVGGAIAYRARHHTVVAFVTRWFPDSLRLGIAAAADALILLVGVVVGYVSLELWEITSTSVTPILQISASWIVLPLNIGMGLVTLFALERLAFDYPGRITLLALPVVAVIVALVIGFGYLPSPRPSGEATLGVTLVLFIAAVLLGLPVSFAMLLGSLFFLQITDSAPLIAAAQNTVDGTGHFILLTLPFFIWAGLIMEKGGISVRLVRFAMVLVGHLRGGLLQVMVVTIYLVPGISGSKAADVVAVGSVLRRELKRQGYRPEEGAAVLSAAGAMSETIPPSIAMLVLGSVTPISIGTLFIAGLLPAAVIAAFLMVLIYFLAWYPAPRGRRARTCARSRSPPARRCCR